MLPAAGELERPIVTPTETNRNITQFPNHHPALLTYQKSTQHNLPIHFVEVRRAGKVYEAPWDNGENVDEHEGQFPAQLVQHGRRKYAAQWTHQGVDGSCDKSTKVYNLKLSCVPQFDFFYLPHKECKQTVFLISINTSIKQTLAHRTSSPGRRLISADYCRPLVLRALWLESPAPCHSTEPKHSPVNCRQSCRGNIKVQR